jgi:hypothetical protein
MTRATSLPIIHGHLGDGLSLLEASIVDQDIDPAKPVVYRPYHRADVGFAADIGADRECTAAHFLDRLNQRVGLGLPRDPRHRHVSALARVAEGDRATDTRGPSRPIRPAS